MISLTIKITGIERLEAKLRGFPEARQEAVRAMASEAIALVDEGFEAARDPEGGAWKPRKRSYPWPPLMRSLAMRTGFRAAVGSVGFTIQNGVGYAGFHQRGTSRMPARRMLPSRRGLPIVWRERLVMVASAAIRSYFGGH